MEARDEIEGLLDWQPPETRAGHTFRRAAATPEFIELYASNRTEMHKNGVIILAVHTNGDTEFAWFSAGKYAPKT